MATGAIAGSAARPLRQAQDPDCGRDHPGRADGASCCLADNVSVGAVYAVAFGTALVGQFAVPAGAAALPRFVARQQLLSANSAFQFTTTSTQLIGLVVLAPIMLKVIGFDASYILSAAALALSAALLAMLPAIKPFERAPHRMSEDVGQIRAAFAVIIRDIRSTGDLVWRDRLTALALIQLISGVMLLFMFAVLVPQFVDEVLSREPGGCRLRLLADRVRRAARPGLRAASGSARAGDHDGLGRPGGDHRDRDGLWRARLSCAPRARPRTGCWRRR